MGFCEAFLAILFFLVLFCYSFRNKNGLATNWPLVGMFPALLKNIHRIHDYLVEIFERSKLTVSFKGPWFTHIDMLNTVDPANVHHIMTTNFGNYYKGPKFTEIVDVFGGSTITSDFDEALYYRRVAHSFIGNPKFQQFFLAKIWEKVEIGLVPVLDYASKQGIAMDLQDLFGRFTFDVMCAMIMDYDPRSLSIELPIVPSSKALDDVSDVIFYRFMVPMCVWKFQRWLGIGKEKKYKKACQTLNTFVYQCIARKREEVVNKKLCKATKEDELDKVADIMTLLMDDNGNAATNCDKGNKFLRDVTTSLLFAGRDTTSTALSWFFYLLSRNPRVVTKIREELDATMHTKDDNCHIGQQHKYLSQSFIESIDKLVYLHAALCETMRLYPPVAWETKIAIEPDILPSGHKVNPNMQINVILYAMGRMKSIWGDDCNEFKPERWISETGSLKHEPSYKFLAFMAGPRSCQGKRMAFSLMKIVASTIIKNYDIEAIEGHLVIPNVSFVLLMKYGFKVKVFRKSV